MIRQSVVAGQFYPADKAQLTALIEKMVSKDVQKEDAIGLVSPHAGYIYSGPVTGAVLSHIKFKDTFIIMGPNHTGLGKPLSIMAYGSWETPLGEVEIDTEMARQILANSPHVQEDSRAHEREHSIELQIPFLQYFSQDFKIVPIVLGYATTEIYKELGDAIAQAIKTTKRKTVIIASSDMTHYEPQEQARQKDMMAIEAIIDLNADELARRVEKLNISMCGYAPTIALITAATKLGATRAELVKYQTSGDVTHDFSSVVGYAGMIVGKMSQLTKLAKNTVETYVLGGRIISPPDKLPPQMKEMAGVFVSIHKLGNLRGCIGTFEPTQPSVAEEIITNAISSATRDPRFPPITPDELKDLEYSVDVLSPPERVEGKDQLDPKKYGIIVESRGRRGLLLPDLEGVDSVEFQINICRQKAGIGLKDPITLYRFRVKRYK